MVCHPFEGVILMKRSRVVFLTIPFLVLLTFATGLKGVRGDEVQLKNGDRVSGTIVTMENKVLTIRTSYAGDLSIKWEAVSEITTDASVEVQLSDDTTAHGVVRAAEDGKLSVKAERVDELLTFHVDDVEIINPPPDYRWKARFDVGIDIEKGNTDNEDYELSGSLIARTESSRFTFLGELDREYDSGDKSEDDALGLLKYDHFFTDKWYGWLGTHFEMDQFKDLNLRSLIGAGPGYQFFETPLTNLSVQAGLAAINEDYDVEEDQSYVGYTWGIDYDRYFLDNMVQFFHWQRGIWSLSNTEDIMIYTRTGFRVPLVKRLSASLQYHWDLDNAVPPGEDEIDQRVLLTLGWELGNYGGRFRNVSKLEYIKSD
jgi:putative salt-induced outer membrane protein YdiY